MLLNLGRDAEIADFGRRDQIELALMQQPVGSAALTCSPPTSITELATRHPKLQQAVAPLKLMRNAGFRPPHCAASVSSDNKAVRSLWKARALPSTRWGRKPQPPISFFPIFK